MFRILINSYTIVSPPVRGYNPRALASGLPPVQANKPWDNYHIYIYTPPFAQNEIFRAISEKGGIIYIDV